MALAASLVSSPEKQASMDKPMDRDRGQHLLRAINGTDITVFYQDEELRYQWIENPPEGWDISEIVGRDDFQILPREAAEITSAAKREVMDTRQNKKLELHVEHSGADRWFEIWIDPDLDSEGEVQGVLCFSLEITERKRKEANLTALLLEVSHRSRNLLAIVQSLANQSLRTSDNHMALERFNKRLQSLAITLDVVTADSWDGAYMFELIERQVKPYLPENSKLQFEGLNPQLTPNAAVHVGLAIQELVSSSVGAHGVIEDPEKICIKTAHEDKPSGRKSCVFEWRETTSYQSGTENSSDMASRTLRRVVPQALGGSALISHSDGKLVYSLTIPESNLTC